MTKVEGPTALRNKGAEAYKTEITRREIIPLLKFVLRARGSDIPCLVGELEGEEVRERFSDEQVERIGIVDRDDAYLIRSSEVNRISCTASAM